jgi:hypothetical protein
MRKSSPPTSSGTWLPTNAKADAEFKQKLAEVFEKSGFELLLANIMGQGEKVEVVRILDELLGQVGLGRRKCPAEVGGCFPLPVIEAAFDLVDENVSAPAVGDGLSDVPLALGGRFNHVQKSNVVAPWNLSNSLLDYCFFRPGLGESPHVQQVCTGKALHVGKFRMKIRGELLDDLRAPACKPLALVGESDYKRGSRTDGQRMPS